MSASGYGPYIVSDLTEYCALPDLIAFLERRFPVTAEQPSPWSYKVCSRELVAFTCFALDKAVAVPG